MKKITEGEDREAILINCRRSKSLVVGVTCDIDKDDDDYGDHDDHDYDDDHGHDNYDDGVCFQALCDCDMTSFTGPKCEDGENPKLLIKDGFL